jgi:hypothetical protein
MRSTLILAATAALLLLSPAAASAAKGSLLWATVNVCDTAVHPNEMGVRASMPGNGRSQRMYMRFRAQWWSASRRAWRSVGGRGGRSSWVYAGSARFEFQQAGWTFSFRPPTGSRSFLMRGAVDYQWRALKKRRHHRARWLVVKRASRITRRGLRGVEGSDPPGTAAASCELKSP